MNPKLKKLITIIVTIFILSWIWYSFLHINNLNYLKLREIRFTVVEHPESLPTSDFAKVTSIWFENTRADIFWLETIQYIGWNAVSSAYKKYLFRMLDLITDLNPYFVHPYKIWMLLLPDYNPRYEDINEEQEIEYVKEWEKLGLKWIENFCDSEKIELILAEDDLQKIWSEDKYKDPCKSYEIPYYLAYIYYFHLQDPKSASDYYKIASANTDSVEWAKILAAIMKWKGWDREKAFLMFLNIWKNLDTSEDQVCSDFATILQNQVWYQVFQNKQLNSEIIKYANDSRTQIFWWFDEEKDDSLSSDTQCSNYINKAVRELNLHYIEVANDKYKLDNLDESALNAKILFDEKYIDYLPVDFQQYEDYWIIYEYNSDTWFFDYGMGTY